MKEQPHPDPKAKPAPPPVAGIDPTGGVVAISSDTFTYGSPDDIVVVKAANAPPEYHMANTPQASLVVSLSANLLALTGIASVYAFGADDAPDVTGLVGTCTSCEAKDAAFLKSANLSQNDPKKVVFHWSDDTTSTASFLDESVSTAIVAWIEQIRGTAGVQLESSCLVAVGHEPLDDPQGGWSWNQNSGAVSVLFTLPSS